MIIFPKRPKMIEFEYSFVCFWRVFMVCLFLHTRVPESTRVCTLPKAPIARNSIGYRSPVKKYIGALVQKSIRVVLVAENDLLEVASQIPGSKIVKKKHQNQSKTKGKILLILYIMNLFLLVTDLPLLSLP